MMSDETSSNENVLLLSTGSLIFETLQNKSSLTLMLSSLTVFLKKAFSLSFPAISIYDDVMLLLSTSFMFPFVFAFSEKRGLTIFIASTFLMLRLL